MVWANSEVPESLEKLEVFFIGIPLFFHQVNRFICVNFRFALFTASHLVSLLLWLSLHFFSVRFYENSIFVNLTPKLLIKCTAYIYVVKFFSFISAKRKAYLWKKKRSSLFAFPEKNLLRHMRECASHIFISMNAGTHLSVPLAIDKITEQTTVITFNYIWMW